MMFSGYVVVAVLAAALNGWAATADFTGARMARDNAARVGVPSTWLFPLGGLKAAGALGLLVGIAVPVIGVAAAIGLRPCPGSLVPDARLPRDVPHPRRRRPGAAAGLHVSGAPDLVGGATPVGMSVVAV
jgi:hypothetical protein